MLSRSLRRPQPPEGRLTHGHFYDLGTHQGHQSHRGRGGLILVETVVIVIVVGFVASRVVLILSNTPKSTPRKGKHSA